MKHETLTWVYNNQQNKHAHSELRVSQPGQRTNHKEVLWPVRTHFSLVLLSGEGLTDISRQLAVSICCRTTGFYWISWQFYWITTDFGIFGSVLQWLPTYLCGNSLFEVSELNVVHQTLYSWYFRHVLGVIFILFLHLRRLILRSSCSDYWKSCWR